MEKLVIFIREEIKNECEKYCVTVLPIAAIYKAIDRAYKRWTDELP